MLDHTEFARWLEASDDEQRVARELVDLKAFNAVVLHYEQACQLMVKGLLRGVGAARQAWGHALSELAERASQAAGLALPDELEQELAVLERDYRPSRCPDALVSGTPQWDSAWQLRTTRCRTRDADARAATRGGRRGPGCACRGGEPRSSAASA